MSLGAAHDLESHLARFSLSAFRQGQREVIESVMAGDDCLVIMPTGSGKSLCFQLPSLAREGVTLVISPLIALMKDQVDSLTAQGFAATYINSSLTAAEQHERLDGLARGEYDLVYVAPERFRSSRFATALASAHIQMLAVDEAHCISEWGHDFRPDYARIGRFRKEIGSPQTIALTATATPLVREDIVKQLDLAEPKVVVTGFARPNLHYSVREHGHGGEKKAVLREWLDATPGAGIIYASTRKRCEEVADAVQGSRGRTVEVYHAGKDPDERRRVQEDFMAGAAEIVIATNAFGMGIDRSDVRFVVHYNIPGTLEAYYQEAGRAGRDGQPAQCLLLYSSGDRYIQEFFIESAYPKPEAIGAVYNFLRRLEDDPIELTQEELKSKLDLDITSEGVGNCEKILEKAGAIERLESRQNMASVRIESDLPTLVDLLSSQAKVQRKVMRAVERIVGDARGERVFLRIEDLAHDTDLDITAVTRALRELSRLKSFDYVPPFRGRAIHMREREKPLSGLGVDFAALAERKAAEYAKLDRLVKYIRTRRCRQQDILKYFEADPAPPCGSCDRCGGVENDQAGPADDTILSDGATQLIRKALSGVARCGGRFGKTVIAGMLCGSQSAKMAKFKLDQLSTFGILSDCKQTDVISLIEGLLMAGYLEQNDVERFRPVIQLTEEGMAVMKGEETPTGVPLPPGLAKRFAVSRPRSQPRATEPPSSAQPAAKHSSPPSSALESDPAPPRAAQPIPAENTPVSTRPTHAWTMELFKQGYALPEVAEIRRLSAEVIYDHLTRCAAEGDPPMHAWVYTDEEIELFESAIEAVGGHDFEELLAELPERISPSAVRLYVQFPGRPIPALPKQQ